MPFDLLEFAQVENHWKTGLLLDLLFGDLTFEVKTNNISKQIFRIQT